MEESAKGNIDLEAATIWVALLMTNSTAGTQNAGIQFVGDITTLDEHAGTNYIRKKLASKAVAINAGQNRAEWDADDVLWTALGAGARNIQGILCYVDANDDGNPADDATNQLISYTEFAAPQPSTGSDLQVAWDATGILHSITNDP